MQDSSKIRRINNLVPSLSKQPGILQMVSGKTWGENPIKICRKPGQELKVKGSTPKFSPMFCLNDVYVFLAFGKTLAVFFRYELIHEDDTWLIRATTKHTMEAWIYKVASFLALLPARKLAFIILRHEWFRSKVV